ncbi:unnamed protein product [Lactuca saligna]|uniref:Amino acid permease/ SLC12A domain-containing protein n=1 Tax=Lactuca saligna TaxID=75948 RepID=A0AA35Y881_LACSI|nr:unnamed protein product [Lactuca saligna]
MGGYKVPAGYFPYGANGVLAGSATVFFSYDGFDVVTSTAEEVKNPQRDVSAVVIGLVPCSQLDPDTPIASAFASYGMNGSVSALDRFEGEGFDVLSFEA